LRNPQAASGGTWANNAMTPPELAAPRFRSLANAGAASEEISLPELARRHVQPADLPPADWLTRVRLDAPRQNIHCLTAWQRAAKRTVDVAGALALLALLAPAMLATAALVKLTSPGPVIFRQTRVGLNVRKPRRDRRQQEAGAPDDGERRQGPRRQEAHHGRPFTMYKFRTMRSDAERHGAQFAQAGDPRVTRLGRFLRRTRLDETPQLWNVLRGEMSLVGPRPERPEFIDQLSAEIPDYLHRLGLKPGLTGLAQVLNGYDNEVESFRRKVALDLLYLQNCCVANDLKIMVQTVGVVLTGKGAL
jgi:lipopolysaccharide/colanic/teichoic acid biosynthesis glycosyltransferase